MGRFVNIDKLAKKIGIPPRVATRAKQLAREGKLEGAIVDDRGTVYVPDDVDPVTLFGAQHAMTDDAPPTSPSLKTFTVSYIFLGGCGTVDIEAASQEEAIDKFGDLPALVLIKNLMPIDLGRIYEVTEKK